MRKFAYFMTPVLSAMLGIASFGQDQSPEPAKAAPAQAAAPASPCPRISVQSTGPRAVRDGHIATFSTSISGGDPQTVPQILWSVNSGAIRDGQQTKSIDVDTTGAGAYGDLTASVWVGGYPGECMTQASYSITVIPPASKADEFGDLTVEQENERLAGAAAAMLRPNDRIYIIAYAGRTSPRGHAAAGLRRMRAQLVNIGLSAGRIGIVDGGYREQAAYELWVVPQGAESPKATPTVDRSEIATPRRVAPTKRRTKP
ncbi:MAG: hypothetical protein AB7F88_11125 [Pyrinomonadaceae bacterium]